MTGMTDVKLNETSPLWSYYSTLNLAASDQDVWSAFESAVLPESGLPYSDIYPSHLTQPATTMSETTDYIPDVHHYSIMVPPMPVEIVLQIARCLKKADQNSLTRCCRQFHDCVSALVYQDIQLSSPRALRNLFHTLSTNRGLAEHVRSFRGVLLAYTILRRPLEGESIIPVPVSQPYRDQVMTALRNTKNLRILDIQDDPVDWEADLFWEAIVHVIKEMDLQELRLKSSIAGPILDLLVSSQKHLSELHLLQEISGADVLLPPLVAHLPPLSAITASVAAAQQLITDGHLISLTLLNRAFDPRLSTRLWQTLERSALENLTIVYGRSSVDALFFLPGLYTSGPGTCGQLRTLHLQGPVSIHASTIDDGLAIMPSLRHLRLYNVRFAEGSNPFSGASTAQEQDSEYYQALRSCKNWRQAEELWRIKYIHITEIVIIERGEIEQSGIFF